MEGKKHAKLIVKVTGQIEIGVKQPLSLSHRTPINMTGQICLSTRNQDHVYFNSSLKLTLKKSSIGPRSLVILSRMVAPSQAFTTKRASWLGS